MVKQSVANIIFSIMVVFLSGCGAGECPLGHHLLGFNVKTFSGIDDFSITSSAWALGQETALPEGSTPPLVSIYPASQPVVTGFAPTRGVQFSLFPRAYAGDCPAHLGFIERIVAIDVRSNADFDDQHPAGASLADILELRIAPDYLQMVRGDKLYKINEYRTLEEIFPLFLDSGMSIHLHLNKWPTNTSVHRLSMELRLDNGLLYKIESDEIDFINFK